MANFFNKLGSALGAVAFIALTACAYHQYSEVQSLNANRPPTLTQLQDSVVKVETQYGICSGWIDKKSHKVLTAAHCFDYQDGDAIVTFNNGEQHLYHTEKITTDPSATKTDHATLVQKNATELIKYPVGLPICAHKPYYGEPIVEMGNPLNVDKVMYFGNIANPDSELGIITDLSMFPGNSGGPIIDENEGCVIGSSELGQLAAPGSGIPYGINYAAPVDNF